MSINHINNHWCLAQLLLLGNTCFVYCVETVEIEFGLYCIASLVSVGHLLGHLL